MARCWVAMVSSSYTVWSKPACISVLRALFSRPAAHRPPTRAGAAPVSGARWVAVGPRYRVEAGASGLGRWAGTGEGPRARRAKAAAPASHLRVAYSLRRAGPGR